MKRALKVSLLANVALALAALYLADAYHRSSRARIGVAPHNDPFMSTAANTAAPVPFHAPIEPFRWAQLESTDYRQYLANLPRIGCPEQTIRDIITADV